jgi:GNAT superfamily N-acetyltransferase
VSSRLEADGSGLAGVRRRPLLAEDLPFLERLYASTRAEEMSLAPWSEEHKAAFLAQQFAAQHAHYQHHYVGATFELLERDGVPIGRLYVARWPSEIRVVDVALLPEARGRGLGGALLCELLAEGLRAALPVTVHVERNNRAVGFYARLGFRLKEDKGVYLLLEWTPDAGQDTGT